MTDDKVAFFMAVLDSALACGHDPEAALKRAAADYVRVYHTQDNRTVLARATEVALELIREAEGNGSS